MKKTAYEQVFEIVDEMYNSLSKNPDTNPDIIKVLMTAGTYLSKKKSAPQIIASKTVSGILFANASNNSRLDQANWDRLKQLIMLAKDGGPMGPTDFRAQF
ncbi:hypothetical protein ACFQAV_10370 [Companilactobacillus huachuanensis]|uniref:Bacteriocin immunity protein n=1 Tax=Companilactobacillus huachuanensis TaxID=2559914 RepID=A0ABW1RPU0_9LACO|nr:hypothetical protein [Companilactobacillus huachuanensis]